MGPLRGVRVLDLSMVVSGPFATMMLADMGADVIKIEPPEGDVMRINAQHRNGVPLGVLNWNRNKRGMVLDLKREGAIEVFMRMAEKSQVVVQNVRPGVVDRLGIGYDAVHRRNPKLVYCSISGYGFSGPLMDKPAYDPIIQGHAGAMFTQTTQGRPRAVKNIIGDKVTGMTATISILGALHEAERTGQGQHLQLAMIDALAYFLMGDTAGNHTFLPHEKGLKATMGTAEPYETADGYIVIAALTDKQWIALTTAVGHPEWFEGPEPRHERTRRSGRNLIELFKTKPSAYWLERIEAADVPCGVVNNYDTIWTDPQFVANDTFFEYEHPKAGRVRAVRFPAKMSETPTELWRHGPGLGEQTDEVLADLGFSSSEIANLRGAQIVK
ncbi:MAG TPA: CaiB/BaiF CoA-transferase family protein [Candidatus Binataceae bacterium]|nr:CaiB/BaiF CoA-transferase family protein [Candidatus Binataceae bacterium]